MKSDSKKNKLVAVIDIGSSAIRMVIAEIGLDSHIRYIEKMVKPVRFGKEVFTTGNLSNTSIREGIEILKKYKLHIDGYKIKTLQAIATNAVREALNRDNFIDQVFMRTGIDVEVIENAEKNRLDMMALEYAIDRKFDLNKKNCLIIAVGTGSTELIIMAKGRVELTKTIPLGSLRLYQQVITEKTDPIIAQQLLKRSILNIFSDYRREVKLSDIDTFIAMGRDIRFVSRQIAGEKDKLLSIVSKEDFIEFLRTLSEFSTDEIVEEFSISYHEAEMLYPALQLYANFLYETRAKDIIIPMTTMRDGLLLEMSHLIYGHELTDISKQVANSAITLGRKYFFDEQHALCVRDLSLRIFDLLKDEHGLGLRERMLLEVSAILHDIGMYIAATSHHKHGKYIIEASDIFGLRKSDKDIVSNVVRYHRKAPPKRTHVEYMSLTRIGRTIVSKLAAILRIADALDRSHQQKVKDLSIEKSDDMYIIWTSDDVGDLSIERHGLKDKGNLFSAVFGSPIVVQLGVSAYV